MADKRIPAIVLFVVAMSIVSMGSFAAEGEEYISTPDRPGLANGIYLILQETLDRSEIREIKTGEILIEYRNEFTTHASPEPVQYFRIKNSPDVPLLLAEAPVKGKDSEGKAMLNIRLADENVVRLQTFTRDNLGRKLVMVIDGKPITAHKIRTEIRDGKVQITRCTDNACEYLFLKLNETGR